MVTSINEPIYGSEGDEVFVEDTIQSNKNEEVDITNKICIQQLMQTLNGREREIITLRYFKDNTQTQVSKMLGISQVQISRIEKKVLLAMRKTLEEMRDYLKRGEIPPIRKNQKCSGCSMKDLCMPSMKKINDVRNEIEKIERASI